MARVLFTLSGMLGDNLLRLPVAFQYAKQHGKQVDLCYDEGSRSLCSLTAGEDWVDKAFTSEGVMGYGLGGQPWDFRRTFPEYDEVYHLGYRTFPVSDVTITAAIEAAVPIDHARLHMDSCLSFERKEPLSLMIHAGSTRARANQNTIETILPILPELKILFPTVIVSTVLPEPKACFPEAFHDCEFLNDGGDWRITAERLASCTLIGTYSSIASLGTALCTPQVVIMDNEPTIPHWTVPRYIEMRVVWKGNSPGLLESVKEISV